MKYLGIDYGSKHIGLALSDSAGRVAMPYQIIPASKEAPTCIANIVQKEAIQAIIIGKSLGLDGTDNLIQSEIDSFIKEVEKLLSIPIIQYNEQFSSRQAKWGTSKALRENPRNIKRRQKGKGEERIDDKAAAIILQSYLDSSK
ncbi:MAG: Holliday junction resolvase RuvX [Patescibacteria group bacterium]